MKILKVAAASASVLLITTHPAMAVQMVNTDNGLPCGGEVVVERGDTLAAIAAYCGVSASDISAVNVELSDPNQLQPGQRLLIPSAVAVAAEGEADLTTLLAPFALYPDALLAEILPAATYPLEIVQAERWARENPDGDPESMNWAPSVTALARYPDVLTALNDNLDQTVQIGDAFLADPDAVFDTIQSLREQAQSAGTLVDNEYQKVIVEPVIESGTVEYVEPVIERQTVIRIVPTYAERVYVPRYDPYWAFHYHPNYFSVFNRPLWSFGVGYGYGGWFNHYLDWHHYNVRVFPRRFYRNGFHYYPNRFVNNWSYWHHRPIHRHGYRYLAQPRARIVQGQRHLVRVSQRAGRNAARLSRANRDYRATERNRALQSSNRRSNSALRQRVTQRGAANANRARFAELGARTSRNANARSQRTRQPAAINSNRTRSANAARTNNRATVRSRSNADNRRLTNRSETLARLAAPRTDRSATRTNRDSANADNRARRSTLRRSNELRTRTPSARSARESAAASRPSRMTNQARTNVQRRAAPTVRSSAPVREQRRAPSRASTQRAAPSRSQARPSNERRAAPARSSSRSAPQRASRQSSGARSAPAQRSSSRERTRTRSR